MTCGWQACPCGLPTAEEARARSASVGGCSPNTPIHTPFPDPTPPPGCGDQLAAQLQQAGALVVDGRPLGMAGVYAQQRTWCANEDGEILP